MKILLVEPFYSGSHKKWADQLKKYSRHDISLLTLEGKFWKWRMYGSAITLAKIINENSNEFDIILATDMLDVATFRGLVYKTIKDIPIITYYHENQFAYPWQANSEDKIEKRDVHYGMINYQSALASDYNIFNSKYNMQSFFEGILKTNQLMPDNKHDKIIEGLKTKCKVISLGLELRLLNSINELDSHKIPIILWNHRLEYDKNPKEFFECLIALKKDNVQFKLVLLGEQTKRQKKLYNEYLEPLKSNIIFSGYCSDLEYKHYLSIADILPVTSIHDFFGISIAEAIYMGVVPILPKRLSYIELYNPDNNPEIFYENEIDLYQKLKSLCLDFQNDKHEYKHDYGYLVKKYDWSNIIDEYDSFFDSIKE